MKYDYKVSITILNNFTEMFALEKKNQWNIIVSFYSHQKPNGCHW